MAEIARQRWSAERYAETAHFVPALGAPVLELLAPSPGEHILDLGCGDGVLTEKIVAAGATVIAVDAGPDMVAAARARGIDARVMDGQKLTFGGEFDAVFSNAALHWMRDQQAVLAGVHRALKPGGRFVAEMGGHNNTAAIIVALSAVLARRGLDAHPPQSLVLPVRRSLPQKARTGAFHGCANHSRPATDPSADRYRSMARHLCRRFSRSGAGAGPIASSRRSRRSVAAGLDGRDRNLDCRLRPVALPRDPRRITRRRLISLEFHWQCEVDHTLPNAQQDILRVFRSRRPRLANNPHRHWHVCCADT